MKKSNNNTNQHKGELYGGLHEIETVSGNRVSLVDTNPDTITIEDIAHGLSMTCRWGGQVHTFFSVAQHCVMAKVMAKTPYKLDALIHDASEAFLGDMPAPYKSLMPDFKKYEEQLMHVIAKKFGITYPLVDEVKRVDKILLEREWIWFRNDEGFDPIIAWDQPTAKEMFLQAYYSLKPL